MPNVSPALYSSSWSPLTVGLPIRDHYLTVPLDHSGQGDSTPDRTESITVHAREISAAGIDPVSWPSLVFLQDGPGYEVPRPSIDSRPGWIGAVLGHHRLTLVDQRGTGASTPVDRSDVANTPADAARLLIYLHVDEIVEDCENLRRALGLERWGLLGRSFGEFCTTRYFSEHAQSLEKVYITGGPPAVGHSIGKVYALSYEAMRLRSEEYYARFPRDYDRMASLVEEAGRDGLRTAGRGFAEPERLRSLDALLDGVGEAGTIHYLLECNPDSWTFCYDLGRCLPFGDRFPLYAVIHEPYWADASTIDWAVQRVRLAVFDDDPALLTGEHMRREVFVEGTGLRPWLEAAGLLAVHEWPALYGPASFKATTTPRAAVVYARDVFVSMTTSPETAALILDLHTQIISEYEHDGSRVSGGRVFKRLRDLTAGAIVH